MADKLSFLVYDAAKDIQELIDASKKQISQDPKFRTAISENNNDLPPRPETTSKPLSQAIPKKKKVAAISSSTYSIEDDSGHPRYQNFDRDVFEQAKRLGLARDHVREICGRTRNLIESLWEEMHVAQREREEFARAFFFPENHANYIIVVNEVSKLLKRRSIHHQVLTYIELREGFISALIDFTRRLGLKGIQSDPMKVKEINSLVEELRTVSVFLVEFILTWRYELPKPAPFMWNGTNYLIKMQSDLDFLKTTQIAELFPYPLESNPFLMPPDALHTRPTSGATTLSGRPSTSGSSSMFPAIQADGAKRKTTIRSTSSPSRASTSFSQTRPLSRAGSTSNSSVLPPPTPSTMDGTTRSRPRIHREITTQVEVERIRKAHKIVFEEDAFLVKLTRDEKMERAAIKIQAFVRGWMSRVAKEKQQKLDEEREREEDEFQY